MASLDNDGASPPRVTVPAPSSKDVPHELTAQDTLRPASAPDLSNVSSGLGDDFVLPEHAFFEKLEERARRADLMAALLAAGGLSPASAAVVMQASLGAVVASATEAGLPSLAHLATALRSAVGNLGLAPPVDDDLRIVDTLVYDESELQRDLVALAVESQGHTVRCAATYDAFLRELEERKPALIVTEIEHENAKARAFCSTFVELVAYRRIPFVFFSSLESSQLEPLAKESGARRHLSKDRGIDGLIVELRSIYDEILATRVTGRRPAFQLDR